MSGPDLWTLFDHKDANRAHWAYEFTEWLTDADAGRAVERRVRQPPAAGERGRLAAFQAQVKALPGLDVMAANSANAKQPGPTVPGYNGLSEAVGSAISHVLQGEGRAAAAPEGRRGEGRRGARRERAVSAAPPAHVRRGRSAPRAAGAAAPSG